MVNLVNDHGRGVRTPAVESGESVGRLPTVLPRQKAKLTCELGEPPVWTPWEAAAAS